MREQRGLDAPHPSAMSAEQPTGNTERGESGLTQLKESRLERQAIAKGWIPGAIRWNTGSTTEDLEQLEKIRPLTLKEKVLLNTHRAADHKDLRMQRAAVKTTIQMEGQNQKDDHKVLDAKPEGEGDVVPLVRVVINNRTEAAKLESLRMDQLEEYQATEPMEDEEHEDGTD